MNSGFTVDNNEILRYLRYNGQQLDQEMQALIDECRELVVQKIAPKYAAASFSVEFKDGTAHIAGTTLQISGDSIKKHLGGSSTCLLFAATLGGAIEREISLAKISNLTKAIVLDAACTAAIESYCDSLEPMLECEFVPDGYALNFRFGIGYGDVDISLQNEFCRVLDTQRKIGLTVSDSGILLPRKSVTAIYGIVPQTEKKPKTGCKACSNYQNCNFKRRED
ncbi:MAG TPA: methionine synthase [Ruminococcaceae bacterium]|nr:methionine synthase [Oscillospiraceae bacterium]